MNKLIKTFIEFLILWLIGGGVYYGVEICWRGYSHWTMFVLGGICFVDIGLINEFCITWNMNIFKQMLIGSVVITVLEFIVGCIVNLWLGWNVWDYSNIPLNLLGQICVPFIFIWFLISLIAILVDDFIRDKFFDDDKPHNYF